MRTRTVLAVVIALFAAMAQTASAAPAGGAAAPPAGLVQLMLQPPKATLSGRNTAQRFMVEARYADGSTRDVTASAVLTKTGGILVQHGRVIAAANGEAKVIAALGGRRAAMAVTVQDVDKNPTWSFANEIVPVLTKAGCNSGGCHGSPSGRGGFRLSLFGYEPDSDYDAVTKDKLGGRINKTDPEKSLILLKPTAKVPHGGGMRFKQGSGFYNLIRDWLTSGTPKQPEFDPRLARIEIYPGEWTLDRAGQAENIIVMAVRDDGTTQDVTPYARFTSNDDQVAEVDDDGRMTAAKPGETSVMVRYLGGVGVVRVKVPRPAVPAAAYAGFKPVNYVDQLVLEKLRDVRIPPSDVVSDAEFLRRASIDTCGTIPTIEETRAFLDDRDPEKRTRLVDRLLNRPEYVDYWTLRWSDLLRNNQQVKQNKGLQVFYRWIRDSVRDNKPYDQLARELVTATGSGYRNGPANWYNTGEFGAEYPLDLASATSQVFLGIRIECARCHNHPFEAWSQIDYYQFGAFFARTKMKTGPEENERIFYAAPDGEVYHPRRDHARPDAVLPPRFLGGDAAVFGPDEDRRAKLADWITSPSNRWFKRSIVNRLWNNYFGRGIVHPVDDYRVTNPSANEKLLDALGDKLVAYKFDLKKIMRDILVSRTYQSSSVPNKLNRDDRLYASHGLPRRLFAEVLLDAVSYATGVSEKLGPYERAVATPDNRVPNGFLDLFGRARREMACECERSEETNVSMVLDLVNGGTVNARIGSPQGRAAQAVAARRSPREITEEFYLAALARRPTDREFTAAAKLMAAAPTPRDGAEDLMWGLLNTREFLFNH